MRAAFCYCRLTWLKVVAFSLVVSLPGSELNWSRTPPEDVIPTVGHDRSKTMDDQIMHSIAEYYRTRHALVLKVVDGLDDQQMVWSPNGTTPCIGFHVWHLARWADYAQAMIAGTGVQIWEVEGLAAQWGFANANLGFAETGLGMHDDVVASLQFPGKEALRDYARRAFAKADQAVGAIGDDEFHRRVRDPHRVEGEELAVGDAVLNWLVHDSRHLGMIECLLGVQGFHGTATR
jgi:hypothetical protein